MPELGIALHSTRPTQTLPKDVLSISIMSRLLILYTFLKSDLLVAQFASKMTTKTPRYKNVGQVS